MERDAALAWRLKDPEPEGVEQLMEAIREANDLAGAAQGRGAPLFDHAMRIQGVLELKLQTLLQRQARGQSIYIGVGGCMDSVEQKKARRFLVLKTAYHLTDGNTMSQFNEADVARDLGLAQADVEPLIGYLVNEGLLAYVALGGLCGITHRGVREYEDAISEPTRATSYFPPVNIIQVEHMEHSVIQQGTHSSGQTVSATPLDTSGLASLLRELRSVATPVGDRATFDADLDTVDAQLRRPAPNLSILRETLKSVRVVLEGAGGTILAAKVGEILSRLPVL